MSTPMKISEIRAPTVREGEPSRLPQPLPYGRGSVQHFHALWCRPRWHGQLSRKSPLSRGEKRRRRWGVSLSQLRRADPTETSPSRSLTETLSPSKGEYFRLHCSASRRQESARKEAQLLRQK